MSPYAGCWAAVVGFLGAAGVRTVFGLPADDLELLAALHGSDVRLVLCRDQRTAAFMATGYALQSGAPGVCVIGKGPAVTNAMTGVLEASSSAAPVLVLGAGTAVQDRGSGAFQELDQVALLRDLAKWAHRVDHPDRIAPALEKAWLLAGLGTPGPVYLEFPDHLLIAPVAVPRPWTVGAEVATGATAPAAGAATGLITASRRPLVVVGGGTRFRNAGRLVERFAERLGAPIFATASGRGVVGEDHELFLGLAGLYRPASAADLWSDADLVIALGSRLEETARFGWPTEPPPVVQVNAAAEGFSTALAGPRVLGDVADVLAGWLPRLTGAVDPDRSARIGRVRRQAFAEAEERTARPALSPGTVRVAAVLASMDAVLPADRITVQENGLQDMWSYFFPHHVVRAAGGSVVPSEQTSLGFGAAASGGVAAAAPDRLVVALVGDGAFAMAGVDLETFVRERLGVLFVVLCNGGYGWLQSQLEQRGLAASGFRFADGPGAVTGAGPTGPGPVGLRTAVTAEVSELESELRAAAAHCRAGGVAVIRVPVDLGDVPPGIESLAGDFPESPH